MLALFYFQTLESLTFFVERTQTPPFFRLLKKQQTITSSDEDSSSQDEGASGPAGSQVVGTSQTHSKRLSNDDPAKLLLGPMAATTDM